MVYLNISERVHLSFERRLDADCIGKCSKEEARKADKDPDWKYIHTTCTIGNCMGAVFLRKDGFTRCKFCNEKGNLLVIWQMTAKKSSVFLYSLIFMKIFLVFSVENTV